MTKISQPHPLTAAMPLVVDLDGTLVSTDTLWELVMTFLKANPLNLFWLLQWMLSGKAYLKKRIAKVSSLEVESLPYRPEFLLWLRTERKSGRRIYLATGADSSVANAIARHLDLFDGVIASDGRTNATGHNKVRLIASALGDEPFEYAGNAMVDIEVWRKSLSAIVVAPDRGVLHALKRQKIAITHHIPAPQTGLLSWLKALRIHQWVKNLLIFTPLLTSHRIFDFRGMAHAALGFVVFGLVASSTYLINDLMDLPADRSMLRNADARWLAD